MVRKSDKNPPNNPVRKKGGVGISISATDLALLKQKRADKQRRNPSNNKLH